jgi:hypothetical protein
MPTAAMSNAATSPARPASHHLPACAPAHSTAAHATVPRG